MERFYDLIIIGSGPAGMSAAIYAARSNLDVMVIEKEAPGGKLLKTNVIENYPGYTNVEGSTLAMNMYSHMSSHDIVQVFENVEEIIKDDKTFIVKSNTNEYKTKYVIIATGMVEKKIGIENESFYEGKGLSYCAICDGGLYKGKDVVVVGGGNAALEESIYLSSIVNNIKIVIRKDYSRAEQTIIDKVNTIDNIEILYNSNVIKINGQSNIESVDIKTNDNITNYKCEGLFPYVGQIPNSNFIINLDLTSNGYIKVNNNYETSIPGIYAVGDIIDKQLRQVVTAVSDGAQAAINIEKKINH